MDAMRPSPRVRVLWEQLHDEPVNERAWALIEATIDAAVKEAVDADREKRESSPAA